MTDLHRRGGTECVMLLGGGMNAFTLLLELISECIYTAVRTDF